MRIATFQAILKITCSELRNSAYGRLTPPLSHRAICAVGQARGSLDGSGGNSLSLNSTESRSTERSLVFARCFTVKERGLCSVGAVSPVLKRVMTLPFTQC